MEVDKAHEMCESRGGRHVYTIPTRGSCGRKVTLNERGLERYWSATLQWYSLCLLSITVVQKRRRMCVFVCVCACESVFVCACARAHVLDTIRSVCHTSAYIFLKTLARAMNKQTSCRIRTVSYIFTEARKQMR